MTQLMEMRRVFYAGAWGLLNAAAQNVTNPMFDDLVEGEMAAFDCEIQALGRLALCEPKGKA